MLGGPRGAAMLNPVIGLGDELESKRGQQSSTSTFSCTPFSPETRQTECVTRTNAFANSSQGRCETEPTVRHLHPTNMPPRPKGGSGSGWEKARDGAGIGAARGEYEEKGKGGKRVNKNKEIGGSRALRTEANLQDMSGTPGPALRQTIHSRLQVMAMRIFVSGETVSPKSR